MNSQTKPDEPETERSSSKEEKQRVTKNVKITIEDKSTDLSRSEEQLILNHGVLLYNLCS